jgi:hypothetical protein
MMRRIRWLGRSQQEQWEAAREMFNLIAWTSQGAEAAQPINPT